MTGLAVGASVTDLVPGRPADLDVLVARCRTVAGGLSGAAVRLRAIDSGEWVGPAGDAFRAAVDVEPEKFDEAGAAFGATGDAVRSYAGVLRDAQASARSALTLYEEAARTTESWSRSVQRYEAEVRAAESTDDPQAALAGLSRPSAYDPGADERGRAESLLEDARRRVADAAVAAARRIEAAWADAPREPRWWESAGHFVAEIGRGAWEATTGLVEFAWSISPARMMVDPQGWARDVHALGQGLAYGVTHPVEFGKVLLDWETWQESPGRAIGHLIPDLLLTLATAGGGAAARGARGVRALDELADVGTTFTRLDRLGEGPARLSYLQRARNFLSGERLPAPNRLPDEPAGLAAASQGSARYPGTDRWFNARLTDGSEFGAGSVSGRDLPFGDFTVPRDVVDEVGTDAQRFYEGVQVAPRYVDDVSPGAYRDELTVLRARGDIDVAVSYTVSNPQYGAGGLRQMYVPELQRLIDDGLVEIVERRPMENIVARIDRYAPAS